jgi:hypothetical protein
MNGNAERRKEPRLRYHWPVWFAEDFNDELTQGQMADISSTSAAFTYYAHEFNTYPGQQITARFCVPRYGPDGSFDMADFVRYGQICRVDNVNSFLHRVAIRFSEPLPFEPGESAENTLQSKCSAINV